MLPFSGMGYAKAMYHASMEYFFSGLSDAITYFGGCPEVCKSDNMTQWVKSQTVTSLHSTMLRWNGQATTILPWRLAVYGNHVIKGPVEGIVYKFYQFIYAAIRHDLSFFG